MSSPKPLLTILLSYAIVIIVIIVFIVMIVTTVVNSNVGITIMIIYSIFNQAHEPLNPQNQTPNP